MSDYLIHWGLGLGAKAEKHKYIARKDLGTKNGKSLYRYFYTQAELAAFKAKKSLTKTGDSIKKSASKVSDSAKKEIKKTVKDLSKTEKSLANSANKNKDTIANAINKAAKNTISSISKKHVSKGKEKVGNAAAVLAVATAAYIIGSIAISKGKDIKDAIINKIDQDPQSKNDKYDKNGLKLKKNKNSDKTADEKAVNEQYNPNRSEYSHNCADCTATWDLRQRGYDVEAIANSSGEYDEEIESWYKGGHIEQDMSNVVSNYKAGKYNTYDDVVNALKEPMSKNGDGAYGHMLITWYPAGGHDVVWSNENGKTIIRDCQTNKASSFEDWWKENKESVIDLRTMRTDNLEITDKIKHACRNK